MEGKRKFILDTLLPYKLNPDVCAYEDGSCFYKTEDGRRCAVGKHLIEGEHLKLEDVGVTELDRVYGLSKILTKDAKNQNLTLGEWSMMQNYHDGVALKYSKININNRVKALQDVTNLKFPELMLN